MYGQLFTVKYINNEADQFVHLRFNANYSTVELEDTTYFNQTILCSVDKEVTKFSISVLVLEENVELENDIIYESDNRGNAIKRFEEFRDLYCDEFPSQCNEIKNEYAKFMKFLLEN